jgi:DNA-directed RNA polymerase specialized sigma24 family protein
MADLFCLSLHLTADAGKAERCLIDAMRECFDSNVIIISRSRARSWAHRVVIRNAIRLVLGKENSKPDDMLCETASDFPLQPSEYWTESLRDSTASLELPDFDRLVFVICVLERFSILDCALLLRRSPKDVNDARMRAINQVVSAEARKRDASSTTYPVIPYSAGSNGIGELDGSCGTLLN